jgi:peptidoglycan/xylan/chitin deacetylase (PgdA/CDA1 family)
MNKKLLVWLAAIMLLTTTACQNTAKQSPATQPIETTKPTAVTGGESIPSGNNSSAGQAQTPPATKPDGTIPAVPAPGTVKSPAPQEIKKLYKMNPKTYDIVPIDPAAATEKKIVLLTFDDGPKDKEMIDSMLDTLDKHHAKAIFFVNGYRVKTKPELVKLIVDRGQIIGNHSWDHIDLKKENKEKVDQQIGDLQKLLTEITGSAPKFFRPPFGSGGDEVRSKVQQEHMLFMTWSNGSLDWEMTVKKNNPDKVISNVLEQLRPGSNILMHELPWTVQALDKLLTELEAKQYGFVDPSAIDTTL